MTQDKEQSTESAVDISLDQLAEIDQMKKQLRKFLRVGNEALLTEFLHWFRTNQEVVLYEESCSVIAKQFLDSWEKF